MFFPAAAVLFAVAGAIYGSFLNVVVHRLPRMARHAGRNSPYNLFWPGSHCPRCGEAIAWIRKIPLLSWLFARGRAHCCGSAISSGYLYMEFWIAVLFAACHALWPAQPAIALAAAVAGGLLLAAGVLLWRYRFLPVALWYVLLWMGLLLHSVAWWSSYGINTDLRWHIYAAAIGLAGAAWSRSFWPRAVAPAMIPVAGAAGAWLSWPGPALLALGGMLRAASHARRRRAVLAAYPSTAAPQAALLASRAFALPPRAPKTVERVRAPMAPDAMRGEDVWHAWELSWLDRARCPQTGALRLCVPADSERIIESQSLKHYCSLCVASVFATKRICWNRCAIV